MSNAVNWFDLPAADFDRAVRFYNTILDIQLRMEPTGEILQGIFPSDESDGKDWVGGAVVFGPHHKPAMNGALVYLNVTDKLDTVLSRIEKAGGKVLVPRTSIGDPGYIAVFMDTEGNKVGLHSPN